MTKPKVLLFDLGGVIVRWVGLDALAQLTGLTREAVIARFASSEIYSAYEIGHCSDDVFTQELIKQFELGVPLSEAKAMWNSWVQACYPGTKSALTTIKADYTLACLSNTNELHWQHLRRHIIVEDYFEYSFASHLIEAAKPSPESYLTPLRKMNLEPKDVWFFDDTLVNVQAAEKIRIKAFHVNREVGVIPTLKELALLT